MVNNTTHINKMNSHLLIMYTPLVICTTKIQDVLNVELNLFIEGVLCYTPVLPVTKIIIPCYVETYVRRKWSIWNLAVVD